MIVKRRFGSSGLTVHSVHEGCMSSIPTSADFLNREKAVVEEILRVRNEISGEIKALCWAQGSMRNSEQIQASLKEVSCLSQVFLYDRDNGSYIEFLLSSGGGEKLLIPVDVALLMWDRLEEVTRAWLSSKFTLDRAVMDLIGSALALKKTLDKLERLKKSVTEQKERRKELAAELKAMPKWAQQHIRKDVLTRQFNEYGYAQ